MCVILVVQAAEEGAKNVIAFWLYSCSPILTTVCSYTEVLGEKILTVFVVFPLVSPCCDAFFFFFGKGISCTTAAKPIGYVLTKGLTEGWLFLNAPKYSKWSCSHCAELCSAHFVANMHFYIWIALLPSLKECGWEPGLGPVREISTSRTPCGAVGNLVGAHSTGSVQYSTWKFITSHQFVWGYTLLCLLCECKWVFVWQ